MWCSGNIPSFQVGVTGSIPVIRSGEVIPAGSPKSSPSPHSPIAQLAEYLTVNQSVPGSSPGGGATGD